MTVMAARVPELSTLMSGQVPGMTAIPRLPPRYTCFASLISYGDRARLSRPGTRGRTRPAGLIRLWERAVDALDADWAGVSAS